MKALFTAITALVLVCPFIIFAQAPHLMNYQGVARDNAGNVLANQALGLQVDIHQATTSGIIVFSETHAANTNAFGLFNVKIGGGTPQSGTLASIDWANGPYFSEVGIDATGGTNYQSMGVSQLLSVPYALFAENSGTPGPQGPTGANGLDGATGATGPQGPINQNSPCISAPPAPETIFGHYCSGADYSFDAIPGADSYSWYMNEDAANPFGTGTEFVSSLPPYEESDYISVTASNTCGTSPSTRIYFNQIHGIARFSVATNNTVRSLFKVPCDVSSINIEIAGAAGGSAFYEQVGSIGGKGAWARGDFSVTGGQHIICNVGAKGGDATQNDGGIGGDGGYMGDGKGGRGGGDGSTWFIPPTCDSPGLGNGGGGGGASDIRFTTYDA